ncbi:MAG TPA: patatin-like phospholipase family protein [Firmicutes bacterium]|nr:patatin-like phospholipase family protein [Bacillota bacterium]
MKRLKLWRCAAILALILAVTTAAAANDTPQIALVLGGGSARGFSHIGLIKALEENGIPIDLIVGTSMGSIIAGLYSAGYSVENLTDIVTAADTTALLDISVPLRGGVVDTAGLLHFLDILLDGKEFAELPIDFYSVIVNLGTGKELALNEGRVSTGILASMSIPGMFPPVLIDGEYYVDGGLKNQVPANVAADLDADVIIAVSITNDHQDPNFGRIINNLRMSLTALIEGYTEMNTALADILIEPAVGLDSSYDYQRADYFIAQGYKAGLEYIEPIKAAILNKDPTFRFIPYQQRGITKAELKQILRTAEKSVRDLPKRFTLLPELGFDNDYSFPQLGFKFTHGSLGWFGVGYRYGFNPDEGGHEAFVDWAKPSLGEVDLYIRKSPNREKPTFGAYLAGPKSRWLELKATYVSQGAKAWQVSASSPSLLRFPRTVGGLSLKVTGLREKDQDSPIQENLLVAMAPQIQIFPWGERSFPIGMVTSRPYVVTSVTMESPVTKLDVKPTFRIGVGGELRLFGLYPSDISLGIEVDSAAKATWRFGLKSIKF